MLEYFGPLGPQGVGPVMRLHETGALWEPNALHDGGSEDKIGSTDFKASCWCNLSGSVRGSCQNVQVDLGRSFEAIRIAFHCGC